ncbi:MAG: META domain-containing protein [Chitinophagales bacterium]|nr:META domain-containing protein [Chitinophagales bacterium]
MKIKFIVSSLIVLLVLQSCSSSKKSTESENTIFWVSGYKTTANSGAGKSEVLNISKSPKLENATWENFYAPIDSFTFEPGYFQKIEVKETELNPSEVPADASSIQYKLVKVLDKQKDMRTELNGNWSLAKLNGAPLNKMLAVPTLSIDLSNKTFGGNNGCNNYSALINNVTNNSIELNSIATTERACINKNVEAEFNVALNAISTYKIDTDFLIFYAENDTELLRFFKNSTSEAQKNLHDIWVAVRIDGNPINRMTTAPQMELNLNTMQIMGNNGCNNYVGKINKATANELVFGNIAVENKMCKNIETANTFNKAISKTATYKRDNLELVFYDTAGNEVVAFLKVD